MKDDLNSYNWTENLPCPLSAADFDRWQSELDAIVGVEPGDVKRWRLVWGADVNKTQVWDRYRQEWKPRYPAGSTVDFVSNPASTLVERKRRWFGIPRLFVEALWPRQTAERADERPGVDADGDVYVERRTTGPEYVTMFCICEHSQFMVDGWRSCCLTRTQNKQACYGEYRDPDKHDIEVLRADYHRRVISKIAKPGDTTAIDRKFAYQAWLLDQAREEARAQADLEDSRRCDVNDLIKVLAGTPGTIKNHYSIPGL